MSYTVETVDLGDHARDLIATARAGGIDPLDMADTYWRISLIIRSVLQQETADE